MALGSSRSYLFGALFDWIVDGGEDPYIIVDCTYPGVEAPEGQMKDQQMVLNLAPRALDSWSMGDVGVTFRTRFSGRATSVFLPYGSITAIYGRESGVGMAFGQEPGGVPKIPGDLTEAIKSQPIQKDAFVEASLSKRESPALRIVKSDD